MQREVACRYRAEPLETNEKLEMPGYKHPPLKDFGGQGVSRGPSLTNQVARRIAAAIDDGTFQPGERLVETRLAEMFGVSRGPVREALKTLQSENIVAITPGRGSFVAAPSSEDVEQIVAARALLEGLAARTVTTHARKRDLQQLVRLRKSMEEAVERGDIPGYLALHWRLHELLCELSNNPVLIQAWQSMHGQLRLFWRGRISRVDLTERLLMETSVLVDSLYGKDPDEADALFRSHIIHVSYDIMGKPIPAWLQSYVTHRITSDRKVYRLADGKET